MLGTILAISAVVEDRVGRSRPPRWRSAARSSRSPCGGCTSRCRRARCSTRYRERGFTWGYGHFFIFGSLAATGAGLHVGGVRDRGRRAHQPGRGAAHGRGAGRGLLGRAVHPLLAAAAAVRSVPHLALHRQHRHARDRRVGGSAGASMGTGIVLTALSPVVVIVGYETVGHRHQAAALEKGARRLTDRRRGADVATSAPRIVRTLRVRPVRAEHLEASAVLGLVDVALREPLGERRLGGRAAAHPRRAIRAVGAAVRPEATPVAGDEEDDEPDDQEPEDRDEGRRPIRSRPPRGRRG